MDLVQIYHKANILIAQTYGITGVPEKGYVIDNRRAARDSWST